MQKTNHYQLNLWDEEDFVLREDFNADNEKLEAALSSLEEKTALSSSAADALGLAGSSATACGAMDFLARYNLHWWRRRYRSSTTHQVLHGADAETVVLGTDADGWNIVQYAGNVSVSVGGILSLSNPQTLTQRDAEANPAVLAGKYFTVNGSIYYCKAGTELSLTYHTTEDGITEFVSCTAEAFPVEVETHVYSYPWQYLQSADRNAYADSGVVDGQEYQYLGIPFENAATAAQIAAGSYVGNGCTKDLVIALPLAAKLVCIQQADNGANAEFFVAGAAGGCTVDGSVLTVTDACQTLNAADKTYLWVAIG